MLQVKPNFKLPNSLAPPSIESQSLYLSLLLLSQTSGQSPGCLVCVWLNRSTWTMWAVHLCSASVPHHVWSCWTRRSLLWINGAQPVQWSCAGLCCLGTCCCNPRSLISSSLWPSGPGCHRPEGSCGELDLCLFIPNVPGAAINPGCSEHAVPAPLWGLETEAG